MSVSIERARGLTEKKKKKKKGEEEMERADETKLTEFHL